MNNGQDRRYQETLKTANDRMTNRASEARYRAHSRELPGGSPLLVVATKLSWAAPDQKF